MYESLIQQTKDVESKSDDKIEETKVKYSSKQSKVDFN